MGAEIIQYNGKTGGKTFLDKRRKQEEMEEEEEEGTIKATRLLYSCGQHDSENLVYHSHLAAL